jgi:hypothetical protein
MQTTDHGGGLAAGESAHLLDERGGADRAIFAVDPRYGDHCVVTRGPGGVDRGLGSGVECHRDDHAGQQNRIAQRKNRKGCHIAPL